MALTPVILCLNRAGEPLAHRLAALLDAPVHGRENRVEKADAFFPNALDHSRDLFAAGHPIIGVCASGILIRAVAPLLADKTTEPPVLSVSDDGKVVIPLLGGHRGANRLATRIATAIGATAAVTTAGDIALGVALDEPPAGWTLVNPSDAKPVMAAMLEAIEPHLPLAKPRYLMGVGSPEDLWMGVERGVDMFDCVLPTRLARNGALFTPEGRINIKQQKWRHHHRPLFDECDCPACTTYDASYIHHLFRAQELLALRLATLHNLRFLAREMETIRASIESGIFASAKREFMARYVPTSRDQLKAKAAEAAV